MSPSSPVLVPSLPRILFGGDYNPEQWPEEVWEEDVRLMKEAGVNFVSVGIFAWAFLEPSPRQYDLDWLRRCLDLLYASGVHACLATATASPPAWFTRSFPASRPMTAEGVILDFGSRQHYCPNSQDYRQASDHLIREIVRNLGNHPAVKMWHINNELGCHVQECHCDSCQHAFRSWLREKYSHIEGLNEAWGTAFWSQRYTTWEQVGTPRRMPTLANPGQMLDYKRFFSASLGNVARAEVAVIRSEGNQLPVTTNGIGFWPACDYFDWSEHLDFAAWDSYPDPVDTLAAARYAALGHDLTRSLKRGRPFLLMEQVTSQVNWRPVNMLKPPGVMRAQNVQAVAHGADACMFFQWRASRSGAEKFHGALVPHFGPGGRVFREVKELGTLLSKLDSLVGAHCPAEVTVLCSWANRWAVDLESKPTKFDYSALVEAVHGALWDLNLPTNFAPPAWAIAEGTKLVVAPLTYLLSDAEAHRLRVFVEEGGVLVMTYFSGVADENEHIGLGGYPAKLTDVLGLRVEEWQPYPEGRGNSLRWDDGRVSQVTKFAEILHLEGARAVAHYDGDFFAGSPAVTVQPFGKGRAWYVSAHLSSDDWRTLFSRIATEAGIATPCRADRGVEILRRVGPNAEFLFAINHNDTLASIEYAGWSGSTDLLTGDTVASQEVLHSRQARVLRREFRG